MYIHWRPQGCVSSPTLFSVYTSKVTVNLQSSLSCAGSSAYRLKSRTREEDIMVDGNKLNSVLEFTYLGSTISSNGCIDNEIQRRMAKASASFGWLRQGLWNNHHVSMRGKGKINRALVLFNLLYGAEARVSSSLVQGYHQEKHEPERNKDQLIDLTIVALCEAGCLSLHTLQRFDGPADLLMLLWWCYVHQHL